MKNNLEEIIKELDNDEDIKELIKDIEKENYTNEELKLYDDNNKFIYEEIIIKYLNFNNKVKTLSQEEFNLLLNIVKNNIIYKINVKKEAYINAYKKSLTAEYRNKYGSSYRAFHNLFNIYLNTLNYEKNINDFYIEYKQENNKTK